MIRVAARRSDGTKLKLNANVNSLDEAWDLLHAELKANKIPAGALIAVQLKQSKQTGAGLQVLGAPRARKKRSATSVGLTGGRPKTKRPEQIGLGRFVSRKGAEAINEPR